jgi:hypothetical protein
VSIVDDEPGVVLDSRKAGQLLSYIYALLLLVEEGCQSPREFQAGKAVGSEIASDVVGKRVNLPAELYCSEIDRLNGSRVDRKVARIVQEPGCQKTFRRDRKVKRKKSCRFTCELSRNISWKLTLQVDNTL